MRKFLFLISMILLINTATAQVFSFSEMMNDAQIEHRIFIDNNYLIETQFNVDPPEFISTRGGFYQINENTYTVLFEFNSNFEQDGLKEISLTKNSEWKSLSEEIQPLDGKWLMAGRVSDEGVRRRDITRPRKTMKFLKDGYFQWTAFNTETFQFYGSGGGTYTAENGKYTETIQYFSRDNSKTGISLTFEFDQKEKDWFHKGFSSKGDPMHEVWTQREN